MSNYLKLIVPIRQNTEWFAKLREAMAAKDILVNWQDGGYHITIAFFNSNEQVEALNDAFHRCIDERLAPSLTLDRVDVFKAQHKPEYIVHLTSSQPSPRFVDFVDMLRHEASNLGTEMESDFKLHITLGRIDSDTTTLEEVKKVVDGIHVPPFTLCLTDAEYRYYRGEKISSWKMDSTQPVIQLSCGEVRKIKGLWRLQILNEDENVAWIGYTDHWTTDTCIVKHNGKYGIFSLPDMSDYGYFIEPIKRRCLDEEPFPYDEIRICGMDGRFFGLMAYRKGSKWGASYFYFVPADDCVDKWDAVPCQYSTMDEAVRHLFSWENPYDLNRGLDESKGEEERVTRKNGRLDYRKINKEVMTDTKQQYETMPVLRSAVAYSIAHQYMVAQEDNIDQPVAQDSQTQYITSGKRSFEAAKAYKGKKIAVLNFANNHRIGGSPFYAGAQEESLCRCSTLFPCLEAMRVPFYEKHSKDYEKGLINAMGNDDLIYTPDVVVFKTDELADPIYPHMMPQSDWYKVDVITCAAPIMKEMQHIPDNYEAIITSRVKKILDVAAKENVEVLILGSWGCGDFQNDSKVVSKAFFTLLENYNFKIVEFALSTDGDVSRSVFNKT